MKNSKVILPAFAIAFALVAGISSAYSKTNRLAIKQVVEIEDEACTRTGTCDDTTNTNPCVTSSNVRLKEWENIISCSVPANGTYQHF